MPTQTDMNKALFALDLNRFGPRAMSFEDTHELIQEIKKYQDIYKKVFAIAFAINGFMSDDSEKDKTVE